VDLSVIIPLINAENVLFDIDISISCGLIKMNWYPTFKIKFMKNVRGYT